MEGKVLTASREAHLVMAVNLRDPVFYYHQRLSILNRHWPKGFFHSSVGLDSPEFFQLSIERNIFRRSMMQIELTSTACAVGTIKDTPAKARSYREGLIWSSFSHFQRNKGFLDVRSNEDRDLLSFYFGERDLEQVRPLLHLSASSYVLRWDGKVSYSPVHSAQ